MLHPYPIAHGGGCCGDCCFCGVGGGALDPEESAEVGVEAGAIHGDGNALPHLYTATVTCCPEV